jgi:ribose-phosphate pyrophosphokinase
VSEIKVFAGTAGAAFAQVMCDFLDTSLSPSRVQRFANDCLEAQLLDNCRERDVFIVQPLVAPVQENLMELLLMIDAARGASAGRVTAVMPHYSYARSDKKDHPRISIGGRLVADLLVTAGVDRVLTMTLHAPQVHAFFRVPTDQLNALRELAEHFSQYDLSNAIVVSPDLGNAKSASLFARMLGTPVAAGAKERFENDRVEISSIIGEVEGRDVIVLDDEIANGSTIIAILDLLARQGAGSVRVACTHGIFSNGALDRIAAIPQVLEIVTTDTVPQREHHVKLTELSVAPAFAEAVRRIHSGDSVSVLFEAGHAPLTQLGLSDRTGQVKRRRFDAASF